MGPEVERAFDRTTSTVSLNDRAAAIAERMVADEAALGITAHRLAGGAVVVDCGTACVGSAEAGRLYAEACMGGLGEARLHIVDIDGWPVPGIEVDVRQPLLACLGSQLAGWAIDVPAQGSAPRFYALGSGPARALCRPEAIFELIRHEEVSQSAVLSVETWCLPPEHALEWIARGCCRVSTEGVYVLVAPTASLAGSVQVAARVVETALYKLYRCGFDVTRVIAASGSCPIAPMAGDDLSAVGRTNDGILYGGRVWLSTRGSDAEIQAVLDSVPSSASPDYGVPFGRLYERACADFYQIDPLLFGPAEIWISNTDSGRTFHAGRLAPDLVRSSFSGSA